MVLETIKLIKSVSKLANDFQSGEMNYVESSGFTTADNADDDKVSTGIDQHFSAQNIEFIAIQSKSEELYKNQKQVHYSKMIYVALVV